MGMMLMGQHKIEVVESLMGRVVVVIPMQGISYVGAVAVKVDKR